MNDLAVDGDQETAKADEKPLVARLYLNRLARNIKLQADPTVKFALGDFAIRRITLAMLNVTGGFLVTHRMLLMFGHKKEKEEKEA